MFNWFRRQFGTSSTPEEQKQQTEQALPEAQPTESEPDNKPVEAPQEDYLNWAKSAFKSIQQRKTQAISQPDQEPEPGGEVAELESEAIALRALPEAIAASEPEPFIVETPDSQPAELIEPVVSVPVWMQKSDRLDILKQTALEAPTPSEETPAPEPPTAAEAQAPDLKFDEEFVWSAKVLAEQGRQPDEISEEEISWLKRLRQGLGKTRRGLVNQLKAVVGKGPLNQDAVLEIESLLLQADVGIEATDRVIATLQAKLRQEALPPEQAIDYLKSILRQILDRPLQDAGEAALTPEKGTLNIWLLTGVNGAGKTTTIGKIAHLAQKSGYSCLIAAADTFRAAAVEQVKAWGERSRTPVIANPGKNTDPAAVVFDGVAAAQSRHIELLLVDTAGRLQNKKNLMEELAKIRRIIDKKAPDAQVESLLVLDATLGQNGLRQAQVFSEAAKLTGVVLTKLDGTAKGGVALAIAEQLNLPIRFIGAGEGIEDLRPFSSYEFVEALLSS